MLALAAAKEGKRVLLCDVGDPHAEYSPLARLFGRDNFQDTPKKIAPGVNGCVLYARRGHELFMHRVIPVKSLVKAAMRSGALKRLLDSAPSFAEMGVMYHVLTLLDATRSDGGYVHDVVIVDMPATGHTLALTSLPDVLTRLIPVGPVAEALDEGRSYFHDADKGAAVIVTLPETLPVTESLELIDGLRETKVHVGAVLVNKMVEDAFTEAEHEALDAALEGKDVFGKTRYQTLRQHQKSLERLQRLAEAPIHVVPELVDSDTLLPSLVDTVFGEEG